MTINLTDEQLEAAAVSAENWTSSTHGCCVGQWWAANRETGDYIKNNPLDDG